MCRRERMRREAAEFGFGEEKADELVSKRCCKDAQVARLTAALGKVGGADEAGEWHVYGCTNRGPDTGTGSCTRQCADIHAALSDAEDQVGEAIEFFLGRPEGEHFSWGHLNIYGECRCPGCVRLRLALEVWED